MYKHKVVNTVTGEETITDLSADEIAVIEANTAKANAEIAAANAKAEAKAAILAKLGLTADEAALLLG